MKDIVRDEKNLLGFGCMRLPVLNNEDATSFDYDTINKMFDYFLECGFNYFDTAYVYHDQKGEEAVRKCLVERHKRDEFEIATKFPMRAFKGKDDIENRFNESLQKLGVEYFDYYLLHNIVKQTYKNAFEVGVLDFCKKKKEEGIIKNLGMSYHDTPEFLDEILSKFNDDLDFVQLQINYLDMDHYLLQCRGCLEIAKKYNKKVIVMEPLKGGTLANLDGEALDKLKTIGNNSPAYYALRFAGSFDNVFKVLSGMTTMAAVVDNVNTFKNFTKISNEEEKILYEVRDIINKKITVPCTSCKYCKDVCPKNIAIPEYFTLYNDMKNLTGSYSSQKAYYNNLYRLGHGKASDCLECGACENICPQKIEIRKYLKDMAPKFEVAPFFTKDDFK